MSADPPTRILILGGTSEATALGRALADHTDVSATLSLAGRTAIPITHPLPTRVGGFGGVDGLAQYLRSERIDILVDATHPFAAQISKNAREAADTAGCRLVVVSRPAWIPVAGDRWENVTDMAGAVTALGPTPCRVFLTIGSLQLAVFALAPQHFYLIRTINPVDDRTPFPQAHFVEGRGPFDVEGETSLMRDHRVEVLVTKNSGGAAAVAKLEAARALGLQVILIRRPEDEGAAGDVATAMREIEAHRASARRGV